MAWADTRAQAISLLRTYISTEIDEHERRPALVINEIIEVVATLKQEAFIRHDMPGVRYWHIPEDNSYWATMPGERLPTDGETVVAHLVMELTRWEFLGRQQINPDNPDSGI